MLKISNIYIVKKIDDANSQVVLDVVHSISKEAKKLGISTIDNSDLCDNKTLIVSVGGDGTMLAAMKLALSKKSYVLGVNLGNVGFLAEFLPNCTKFLHNIVSGKTKEEERLALMANINGHVIVAVNEISVAHKTTGHLFKYNLTIGDYFSGEHRADGVLVSTPTGSTGYALSCGGALLDSELDALEVVPIAPLTMSSRPLIMPSTKKITITPIMPKGTVVVRADGHDSIHMETTSISDILIQKTSNKIKLLHATDWNFYHTLSDKLGWNRR